MSKLSGSFGSLCVVSALSQKLVTGFLGQAGSAVTGMASVAVPGNLRGCELPTEDFGIPKQASSGELHAKTRAPAKTRAIDRQAPFAEPLPEFCKLADGWWTRI